MPPRGPHPRKRADSQRRASGSKTHGQRPRAPRRDIQQAADGESGDRLQKVLAAAGVASRRDCEQLILEGRVEVDRQVVTELGTRVDPQKQEIRVDGESLSQAKLVYFAINKPTGVVSTARDPAGRTRVTDLMPPNAPRVFCVGRLDIASEGLILVTNDGELANGLTHPRHGVEKIYQVKVAGQVENEVLAQLHRGIHLAEGFAHVKHVRIKSHKKRSTILEMVLDEGRNREVRRLLARVGHKVQELRRVAVGPVRLGELPTGAVRPLSPKEIKDLKAAVQIGPADERSPKRPPKRVNKRPATKPVRRPSASKNKDGRTVIG
jgi:23S rRNA pseudouridine2605 synthase